MAAAHGYEAAWLTPLLTEPDAAAPLLSYPAAQLVVIGASDPYLDQDVLDALSGEHLVVPGDHVLRVPGDPAAMVASHDRFVRAFDAWLGTLSTSSIRSRSSGPTEPATKTANERHRGGPGQDRRHPQDQRGRAQPSPSLSPPECPGPCAAHGGGADHGAVLRRHQALRSEAISDCATAPSMASRPWA